MWQFSEEVDADKAENALITALTAMSVEMREHVFKALLASLTNEEKQKVFDGI